MNSKSKTIARFGIIAALIVAAISIDMAISAAGLPVNIAAVTLTVVLVVCQINDLKTALFVSTLFGLSSFIGSYIIASPTAWYFQNPLISVFPRIVIGLTTYYSLKLFKKLFKKYKNNVAKTIPYMVSGAVGVLTNTILVLTMMAVFDKDSTFAQIIATVILINFLIEILFGILVVPTVSRTVLHARRNVDIKDEPNSNKTLEEQIIQKNTQQDK